MKSGRYSVRELLADGDIGVLCVPEIQRDYVWGKDNVEPFLKDIIAGAGENHGLELEKTLQALPENRRAAYRAFVSTVLNRHNVGFLYAYFDPEVPDRYFLIDGQQRFTTLFLTMAILAAKAQSLRQRFISRYFTLSHGLSKDDYRSYAPKFDYRVREVAHVFLQHFVYDLVVGIQREDIAKYIGVLLSARPNIAQEGECLPWWQLRFETDKTVGSILGNARQISSILDVAGRDCGEDFFEEMFTYIEDSVEFWYFDTHLSAQGEELYIYMNSRGEQLSYNENRRAACIACIEQNEKNEYGKNWDERLQNRYFLRRGQEPSADKGLDLFLRTVEMIHLTFKREKTKEAIGGAWQDFFQRGAGSEVKASKELLCEYLEYQQAVEFLWKVSEDDKISETFRKTMNVFQSLQQGRWIGDNTYGGEKIEQIDILPVLACLELFRGSKCEDVAAANIRQKVLAALYFIVNLVRHENVRRNPASWVMDLMSVAAVLRENEYDVTKLLNSGNGLLKNNDEKWRLELLFSQSGEDRESKIVQMLGLFHELAGSDLNVLFGDIYILFATAFGKSCIESPKEILEQAKRCSFDVLSAELRWAHAACRIHFGDCDSLVWYSAHQMLKQFGDYTKHREGERLRFPHDLWLRSANWQYNWHSIMVHDRNAKGEAWPRANPVVVRYLRSCFSPQQDWKGEEISNSSMCLFSKIASTDVGQVTFKKVWDSPWTDGRFRYSSTTIDGINVYDVLFKTGISVFGLYSERYQANVMAGGKISVNGVDKQFEAHLMEDDGTLCALIKTDEGLAKCELAGMDDAIKYFVKNGTLVVGEDAEVPWKMLEKREAEK